MNEKPSPKKIHPGRRRFYKPQQVKVRPGRRRFYKPPILYKPEYEPISVSLNWPWWKKMLAFIGPGYMVAVGYVDPGNWATDLAGGSQFGYTLLSILLISNLIAILLQFLACKLGIVTERDLAQACRDHFSPPVSFLLWIMSEIAIMATDLAEIIGSAIALLLLFHIPIIVGVWITAIDIFFIIYLQRLGFRYLEAFVMVLMLIIGGSFWFEILFSHPDLGSIMKGLVPTSEIITNKEMLYISIGIVGAVIMPHSLYLHSALVQTRQYKETAPNKLEAIKYTTIDSVVALTLVFFINAAILIMSAAVFYKSGHRNVAELQEAYQLLTPMTNAPLASTLFALALLASGQNSTLTGTLAGQIVMEGFLQIRLRPWIRRLMTRGLALLPAVICIIYYGEKSLTQLLIFSQVIISLTLSFALIPLVNFTGNKKTMGEFVNSFWIKVIAWVCAIIITFLNIKYVTDFIGLT